MEIFTLCGKELTFPPPARAYRDLFVRYRELADLATMSVSAAYTNAIDNVDNAIGELAIGLQSCLHRMADEGVQDLVSNGIFNVDESVFLEAYQLHIEQQGLLKPIADILEMLVPADGEGAVPGQWIGGGFGLEGVAQGVAIATVANLITSGVSSLSQNSRRSHDRRHRRDFLKSPKPRKLLQESTEKVAAAALDVVAGFLTEYGAVALSLPSDEERQRAKAIIRNVAKERLPSNAAQDATVEAIKLNPYDPLAYVVFEAKFGAHDDLNELQHFLEIDAAEAASTLAAVELIGAHEAVKISHLDDAILSILSQYKYQDLYVHPNIPQRKARGARDIYFNHATFRATSGRLAGSSEFENSIEEYEPGILLAVIDNTLLGSAANGAAFGSGGLAWKGDTGPACMASWSTLVQVKDEIRKTLFGVAIGNAEISLSGSDVKRSALLDIIHEIIDLVENR